MDALALPARSQGGLTLTPSLADRIDRIAKDEVHAGRTPGLAIGVIEDGRLVYARGFGFATLVRHAAMTRHGVLRRRRHDAVHRRRRTIACARRQVKPRRQGQQIRPEFHLGSDITIAQLLTQTSGLPSYDEIPNVAST